MNELIPNATELTKEEKLAIIQPMVAGPFQILSDGRIDCTLLHPVYGPVPFTADANDYEEHGRLIHEIAAILAV